MISLHENYNDKQTFPCSSCSLRSPNCSRNCTILNQFLKADEKCHTRRHLTELVLDPETVSYISDINQADSTKSDYAEFAAGALCYWDIWNCTGIDDDTKVILEAEQVHGMKHRDIAKKYRISLVTVRRTLKRAKAQLRGLNLAKLS